MGAGPSSTPDLTSWTLPATESTAVHKEDPYHDRTWCSSESDLVRSDLVHTIGPGAPPAIVRQVAAAAGRAAAAVASGRGSAPEHQRPLASASARATWRWGRGSGRSGPARPCCGWVDRCVSVSFDATYVPRGCRRTDAVGACARPGGGRAGGCVCRGASLRACSVQISWPVPAPPVQVWQPTSARVGLAAVGAPPLGPCVGVCGAASPRVTGPLSAGV